MSTTLQVELPLSLSEDEARTLLAVKLFEVGKVTLGQAAKIAGFTKRSFMDVLGRHNVAVFNYPADELSQEVGP
jgi:predicted HTH domain antitoxin